MRSVVIYASRNGNTRTIAEVVATTLESFGPSRIVAAEQAPATVWRGADLLVVGGPTEDRHATPPLQAFFGRLPAHALRGIQSAAFDTRLAWPRLLSGSAAADIRRWLHDAEADPVGADESFIVTSEPRLRRGERERAVSWAQRLGEAARSRAVSGEAEATPGVASPSA